MIIRIRKIKVDDLLSISVCMLIVLICLPITQCLPEIIRKTFQAISIGLFLIGILLKKDFRITIRYVCFLLFFGTYVIMVWQYRQSFFTCLFNVMSIVEILCYGLYVTNSNVDIIRLKRLFILISILMTISALTTIVGLIQYPLAVRELGRSVGYASSYGDFEVLKWTYRLHNIAGWSQVYGFVFYVPIALLIFKKGRGKFYLISAVICEVCIIMGQVTFALLLSIILLFLVIYRPPTTLNKFMLWISMLFIIIVTIINFRIILEIAINYFNEHDLNMLANKMNDLYLLTNKSLSGDAFDRVVLYNKSINIFKNNLIFGFSLSGKGFEDVFCYHSDFFDMLGFYGCFGIVILVWIVSRYIYWIYHNIVDRWVSYVLLAGLISLYIFNPVWYSPQIFLGGMLVPAIISCINNTKNMDGMVSDV